ncbi:MAG: tetratricopeptide repeat protein [Endomicrobium sp.]|nr:tetratricopeptide repeat protein [Endomicrobium sp.]
MKKKINNIKYIVLKKHVLFSLIGLILLLLFFLFLFLSYNNIRANNKAVRYFNKGNFEEASKSFDEALVSQFNNYSVLNNAASVKYKLNKFEEAKVKYNEVLTSSKAAVKEEKFIAFYDLGNVEYKEGNFQKAIDLYKEALKLNPKDKDAKYNLEKALLILNKKSNIKKNDKEEKKCEKQNNSQNKQSKGAHNLKRQMKQNEKLRKENEKKIQELNNSNNKNDSKEQQNIKNNLEKEQQKLDNQKQEISENIEKLKEKKLSKVKEENKNQSNDLKKNKENDFLSADLNNEKRNKKDPQTIMFLNYYGEADKNADKLRNKNKKLLINKPKEDW